MVVKKNFGAIRVGMTVGLDAMDLFVTGLQEYAKMDA